MSKAFILLTNINGCKVVFRKSNIESLAQEGDTNKGTCIVVDEVQVNVKESVEEIFDKINEYCHICGT